MQDPIDLTDTLGLEWQASAGLGGTGAFLFGGLGASVNIGVNSNGSLFFQVGGDAEVGLGAYIGGGLTGGINHKPCFSKPGWSEDTNAIVEGDAGYGPSVGGALTFDRHSIGASTGLGKFGVGGGIWAGAGAIRTYTYTTPTLSQLWGDIKKW